MIFYLLIALLAGAAVASQAAINSQLAQGLAGQPLVAAMISFAIGTIVLLLLCLWRADLSTAWQNLPTQTWWKWLGGILGATLVFTSILLAPKMGITQMLFFIIIGQLIMATLIDYLGLFGMQVRPIHLWQGVGLFVIAIGLILFFFGKRLFGNA